MTERLRDTDWNQSVCSQELAQKMTTQRGHVCQNSFNVRWEVTTRNAPNPAVVKTRHCEPTNTASECRLILTSLVATPAFVHGHDATGETQVITPSSLCKRSLPLPKNRQSSGCTSSSSLTAQPLQTVPFVKLFQGERSLPILHSAPSAGSKMFPLLCLSVLIDSATRQK